MSTSVMPPGVEPHSTSAPRGELGHLDLSRIAQDLQIRKVQVEAVVQLLDEGNTIPFITRYRKERTGGLNEDVLRTIQERIAQLRHLAQRKQTILNSIDNQGKLTPELRSAIRDATKATTTFGYGPRFLHSTGQLHKGGPPNGLFLQLTHDGGEDVPVPGEDYSFGQLKNAQADGDLLTLRDHGLPAERVRLEGDPAQALRELTERIRGLLG